MKNVRQKFLDFLAETGMSVAEFERRSGVSYDVLAKLKQRENSSTSAERAAMIMAVIDAEEAGRGFSEGPQPQIDVAGHLLRSKPAQVKNSPEGDEINIIRVAVVGDKVQVAGTYDKDGLDRLIRKLSALKSLIED